jgi:uncharacterized protein with FMN-binding domain
MASLGTKTTFATLTMLTLATTLVGCGADTATPPTTTDGGAGADTNFGDYTDGTYTESGTYQAPSGTETVDVTVTLTGNVVTSLEVVGEATDPTAKLHQGEFITGIQSEVVGKNIDELSVDKVGGSSLTSGGFNAAIAAIKADAAA